MFRGLLDLKQVLDERRNINLGDKLVYSYSLFVTRFTTGMTHNDFVVVHLCLLFCWFFLYSAGIKRVLQ